MSTDPYRKDPDHPVDQLRQMALLALEGLTAKIYAMPPSKMQDLAVALADLNRDDAPKTPVDILAALRDLAPRAVPGIGLLSSRVLSFQDERGDRHLVYPQHLDQLFYAKSLRIEVVGDLPADVFPEFEVCGTGSDIALIQRCSIREFLEMTPFSGTCVTQTCPLSVRLWPCPKAPEIRLIFRGDEVQQMSSYMGYPTGFGPVGGMYGTTGPFGPNMRPIRGPRP